MSYRITGKRKFQGTLISQSLGAVLILAVSLLAWPPGVASQETMEPLTLRKAVEISLQKNPQLRAASHRAEAADFGIARARAGFLPKVDAGETFQHSDNPVFAFGTLLNQGRFTQADFDVNRLNHPGAISNFRTQISLVQPIYTGGKSSILFEQARLASEAAKHSRDRARQELMFVVAKAYYSVLVSQERLEVVKAALRTAEANLEMAQARFDAGFVVASDLLSAQVRLAALQQELASANNQVALQKAALNEAMGLPLDEPFTLADRLAERANPYQKLEDLAALALGRRPDYREAQATERSRDQGVSLARSSFFPTLSAATSYEVNTLNFVADGQDNWSLGVVLQVNLFNGGADSARLAEAKAERAKTQAEREGLANRIRLEAREAWLKVETARERVRVAARAVEQAEESLRIVQDRYGQGLTTIVELLTTEASVTQARSNVINAFYDLNVGLAQQELALGTLDVSLF